MFSNPLTSKNRNIISTFFLLFITSLVILLSVIYITDLKHTLNQEAEHYLTEISSQITQLVDSSFAHIEEDGSVLRHQLEEQFDIDDIPSYLPYVETYAKERGYLRICIADGNGVYHATDGYGTHISDAAIYEKIMRGEAHFINYESKDEEQDSAIIYGIPLYKNGVVKAALFLSSDNLHLSETMDIQSFNNEGFSVIINSSGDYVFHSKNKNSVQNLENFFEMDVKDTDEQLQLMKMKENLQAGECGFIEYTSMNNGLEKFANYRPIGYEDWYLLSVTPTAVMTESLNVFLRYSLIIVSTIICLFLLVILMLYYNQKNSRKYLEQIAYVDPVTKGANNSRFAMDSLERIKTHEPGTYCMVSMDIRNFKIVNATFGSQQGNELLAYIYRTISHRLVEDELVARVSGDVYHLLLRYTSQDEIKKRLTAMIAHINSFNEVYEYNYYLYFQTGVYIIDIPDLSMIMIQDRANVARKKSKQTDSGEWNTCLFYRDTDRKLLLYEKDIENRMEKALEHGEFTIYLHPKYNLKKEKIAGAEALIRWNDPQRGMLLPQDFLPIFERNGFILKIDLFVFRKACEFLQKQYDAGNELVQISVNISRLHLSNPKFLDEYLDIFKQYTFPAAYIRFEVTETLVCENLALLKDVLQDMHRHGFTISLDDFGSGYSSLNLLKDIEADELKLDREFFMKETIDERSASILRSIINLAKELHMVCVSEGVQTEEQISFLKEIECDMIQAFICYKPLSMDEFEKLLLKST